MNINNKKSIEENVKDLDDLHMLVNLRSDAYKNGQILDEILIYDGDIILTEIGEIRLVDKSEHNFRCKIIRNVTEFPNNRDKCPICNKMFTVSSLSKDCVLTVDQKIMKKKVEYTHNWYHKYCYEIYNNRINWDHFRNSLYMFETMAKLKGPILISKVPQPSICNRDCYYVRLSWDFDGSFYVTIRKNNELSILIEWSDTYPEFSDTFDDIKKTTDSVNSDRMIYVKSYTDMVNVLVRAHKSIIKK